MKIFKSLSNIASALLFILAFGTAFSIALDVPPMVIYAVMAAVSIGMSFLPKVTGAFSGVLREMWTGEVIKYLTNSDKDTFLQGIADYSKYVSAVGDEAQVIHLVDMDVLPDVLINNTTYPLTVQTIGESDVIIQLDKYDTKPTPITDDELYALSYKKIGTLKDRHGLAIAINRIKKAIHSFGPADATKSAMPVLLTTGDDDGNGRKKLTWADILSLKRKVDDNEDPEVGRRLVLCNDHLNDLLESDQKFKDQYYNRVTGKFYNQYGFDFYDYAGNPYYTTSTKKKLSFGAVPTTGDYKASVYFNLARSAKAEGWTKMYYSKAENDTLNHRNLMNFRNYFIVLPTKEEARGAILSDVISEG